MYRNAPIASPLVLSFDRGTLLLRGAGPQEMISADPARLWEWDARVTAYRCDAIHYAAVRSHLQLKFGPRFRDLLPPSSRVAFAKIDLPTLRPEQQQAVAAWQTAGHRGMVVMPTGTGKTEVALAAMAAVRVSTLIVAPVRDLMHQWHQRILRRLGYDAGIVGDSILNIQPITVTTYDSAYARMPEMGDRFGLIIFDEAHHLPGRSYREAAMFSSAPMRLGLTATPDRADGRHVDPAGVDPEVHIGHFGVDENGGDFVAGLTGQFIGAGGIVRFAGQSDVVENALDGQQGEAKVGIAGGCR